MTYKGYVQILEEEEVGEGPQGRHFQSNIPFIWTKNYQTSDR